MRLELLKLIAFSSVLIFSSFLTAQMQNHEWSEVDLPNNDQYEPNKVDVSILDGGRIFMVVMDNNTNQIIVYERDLLTGVWDWKDTLTVSNTPNDGFIKTYKYNNILYIAYSHIQNTVNGITLLEFDADNDELSPVFNFEESSFSDVDYVDVTYNSLDSKMYFTGRDENTNLVFVDYYDFSQSSYVKEAATLSPSNVRPSIAMNFTDNELLVSYTGTGAYPDTARVVYADLSQATLSFDDLPGTIQGGILQNPLMAGVHVSGSSHTLVEKNSGAPDFIYYHYDQINNSEPYRLSLDGSNTDAQITTQSAYNQALLGVAGREQETYIFGGNNISLATATEIFSNGDNEFVADNNPTSSYGADRVRLAHSSVVNRLVGYYEEEGSFPNPQRPGKIMITNLPPEIGAYDELNPCFGMPWQANTPFIDNLTFLDDDGDSVNLIGVQNLTPNIVNAVSHQANGLGGWLISGEFENEGEAIIDLEFTDGLDTVFQQITFDALDTVNIDFDESEYFYCWNDGLFPIELDEKLVDASQNGVFTIYETPVSEPGFLSQDDFHSGFEPDPNEPEFILYELLINGCMYEAFADIWFLSEPEVDLNVIPSSCGENDGEVSATITSPNGNYFTYWNNGTQDENSISDLAPGSYTINVEDEEGCKTSAQTTVQASGISVNGTVSPLSCRNGNDASIELSFSGFNGTPNILWSTGASSQTLNNVGPGVYSVTVWEDSTCQITENFVVQNPDKFEVWFNENTPSSCNDNDGEISVFDEINATGNVTYDFPNIGQTGMPQTGLGNGAYEVVATDDAGCTYEEVIQLNHFDAAWASETVQNATCNENDGAISLNVFPSSGETVTGYQWSNNETTKDISNLSAGKYTVSITQSNGCTSVFQFEVGVRRPAKQEICMVTVDSATTTNLIVWEKPETNTIDYYNIYRETSQSGTFELAGSVDYDDMSVFNDVVASPAVKSWRYRITAVNHCGVESSPSSIHKTIHLVTQEQGGGEFKVIWDNYEGIPFTEYDCMRFTDEFGWEVAAGNLLTTALPYYIDTPPATDGLDYIIEIDMPYTCTADFGKAQDYNSVRSNKRRSSFFAGEGTGDPNNDLPVFENQNFGASVFPNPSNGNFNIDLSINDSFNGVQAEIIDVTGKVVYSASLSEGLNKINLSNAGAGIYIVKMSDGEFVQNLRIVKE